MKQWPPRLVIRKIKIKITTSTSSSFPFLKTLALKPLDQEKHRRHPNQQRLGRATVSQSRGQSPGRVMRHSCSRVTWHKNPSRVKRASTRREAWLEIMQHECGDHMQVPFAFWELGAQMR